MHPDFKSIVQIVYGWRLFNPARIEWVVGSIPNADGTGLDDFALFECRLAISKAWKPFLNRDQMEAVLNHEVTHVLQNVFDCEHLVLVELCNIKNKKLSTSHIHSLTNVTRLVEFSTKDQERQRLSSLHSLD